MGIMSPESNSAEGTAGSGSRPAGLLFVTTMADTTWRMFVPSIGLTLLGVWLDGKWQAKPWLMMSGIALGVVFAFVLVRQQLRRLKPAKGTK